MKASMKRTTASKTTVTAMKVRQMIKNMNREAHEASAAGEPVAYCFFGGSYDEILRAMDIKMVFPENWAPVCAAKRDSERFIKAAEAEGYSHNLCTYLTCSLGYDIMRSQLGEAPPNAPDGGLAKPTVMLGQGHMICDPRTKFFQALQRYMDVPVYVNNTLWPPYDANLQEVKPYYIKYYVEELEGLVTFLERNTGRRMDWERLRHLVDLSFEAKRLWWAVYQLRKTVPSPMPTQDAMNILVPGLALLGTQESVDFYRELYDEVKHRVENKLGVISDEKYRILWGAGVPPWYALILFNFFEKLGAVFAMDVQYRPFDPVEIPSTVTHPLERVAWRWFGELTERYEKAQKHTGSPSVELLLELIEDYNIDGIVMNRAYSCRGVHMGELYKLNRLREYTEIPSMILEYDMVDMSGYSEEHAKERINEFVELVAEYKSGNRDRTATM